VKSDVDDDDDDDEEEEEGPVTDFRFVKISSSSSRSDLEFNNESR
jgi:hypothetical protein